MNKYYPVMLDIQGKKCIVIGGGKIALRKTLSLLEGGAKVTVISIEINKEIRELAKNNKIKLIEGKYNKKYMGNCYLVYAATDNKAVNEDVYKYCNEKNILVNVVDKPEICNFIVPSKLQRGDLTIAISTNGKSPMLARKIRLELEEEFDDRYEVFLNIMGEVRKEAFKVLRDANMRSEFYKKIIYGNYIDRLVKEDKEEIKREILEKLNE